MRAVSLMRLVVLELLELLLLLIAESILGVAGHHPGSGAVQMEEGVDPVNAFEIPQAMVERCLQVCCDGLDFFKQHKGHSGKVYPSGCCWSASPVGYVSFAPSCNSRLYSLRTAQLNLHNISNSTTKQKKPFHVDSAHT